MANVKPRKVSSIYRNDDFIHMQSYAVYRSEVVDPYGKQLFFKIDATLRELGSGLRTVLDASRMVSIEEIYVLRNLKNLKTNHENWIDSLKLNFGYKTKNALFRKMIYCGVVEADGFITIWPTHHDKLESWWREKDDGIVDVIIPSNSTPEDVGAAVKLALSRCTGPGALGE